MRQYDWVSMQVQLLFVPGFLLMSNLGQDGDKIFLSSGDQIKKEKL